MRDLGTGQDSISTYSTGYLKVKTLPRCVLCHSLFQYCCAGNSHHNCMIIPHPSPLITRSLSNYFFYFLCWAPLPDLMTRDLRLHNKMLSDLETDSTLIVGFNTLTRHETCYHVTTLMRSAVSRNYNRSPWDQVNPGETWVPHIGWLLHQNHHHHHLLLCVLWRLWCQLIKSL